MDETEASIKNAFYLATRWQAILLIDEADIFMFKRKADDYLGLMRNAIVTIFLRMLEYYQGFLFLTTNRVDDFDPAFDSRIHMKIYYPELTPDRRTEIWKHLLGNAKNIDKTFTEEAYQALGSKDLNGRVIKNTIRTASEYASAIDKELSLEHILLVLNINTASHSLTVGSNTKMRSDGRSD